MFGRKFGFRGPSMIEKIIKKHGTVNSRFKKVHFSFLKSRVVWFKKDLCSESKNWLSEKNALCRWICNLRSFLNREFIVYSIHLLCLLINLMHQSLNKSKCTVFNIHCFFWTQKVCCSRPCCIVEEKLVKLTHRAFWVGFALKTS